MDYRTIIKHTDSGDLIVRMKELKDGDKFTIKEPDGTHVGTYIAREEPYYNNDRIAIILCDLIRKKDNVE